MVLLLYFGFITAALVSEAETSKLTSPSINLKPSFGSKLCQESIRWGFWLLRPHIIIDWNSHMRATNGNIRNTITLAHWNVGSSALGKSEKGIEKL